MDEHVWVLEGPHQRTEGGVRPGGRLGKGVRSRRREDSARVQVAGEGGGKSALEGLCCV